MQQKHVPIVCIHLVMSSSSMPTLRRLARRTVPKVHEYTRVSGARAKLGAGLKCSCLQSGLGGR